MSSTTSTSEVKSDEEEEEVVVVDDGALVDGADGAAEEVEGFALEVTEADFDAAGGCCTADVLAPAPALTLTGVMRLLAFTLVALLLVVLLLLAEVPLPPPSLGLGTSALILCFKTVASHGKVFIKRDMHSVTVVALAPFSSTCSAASTSSSS